MTEYCYDKAELAQYVNDFPDSFVQEWPWIMTIKPEPSGGFSVHTAIGTELEDTVENTQIYLDQLLSTSKQTTPAG